MRPRPAFIAMGGLACWFAACAAQSAAPKATRAVKAGPKASPKAVKASFQTEVLPLLKKYCINCHSGDNALAGISLSEYKDEASMLKARELWEKVAQNVASRHMPPKNLPQPPDAERTRFTSWINARLTAVNCGVRDPGRVTMRRLNRAEYNNTIRDLIGVDFRPADDFPGDDVGYGFDNIGDVLSVSPILMEKYLAAAEKITEKAILTPDPHVERYEAERMPETRGDGAIVGGVRNLYSTGEVWVPYSFPADGEYILRARAYGQQAGNEPAKMAFRLDGKDVKVVDVPATEQAPGIYEIKVQVTSGQRKVAVAFTNDFYQAADREKKIRQADRNLLVDYLEVEGPLNVKLGDLPESHKRIIWAQPTPGKEEETARRIMEKLAFRAFRRPPTAQEVDRLVGIVRTTMKEGDSFERGIQLATQAVLVSPNFLFRVELDREPNNPKASRNLNDFELASRLSYFLWSSMPDNQLLSLAQQGQLKKPQVLEQQAIRMLKDPKAQALVENFFFQWLTLRNLQNFNPDRKMFPAFTEELRADMLRETQLFVEAMVREDRNVMEFLDGRFTYLNERLASLYGIPGVSGNEFRKVTLNTDQRMGVLTQASILAITSNPTRTSPVKRGKWVLDQMLGTPPPPAPPDVPALEEGNGAMLTGTLREKMEQHRKDPGCASCHARLDPIGFGLENFDAIGAWRTKDGGQPVDASGELPDGQAFNGPAQLIEVLKKQKSNFVRNLNSQLLTYALGRGLEYYDRCSVDAMTSVVAKKGYRFSALVTEVVKSEPFRMRRGDGGGH